MNTKTEQKKLSTEVKDSDMFSEPIERRDFAKKALAAPGLFPLLPTTRLLPVLFQTLLHAPQPFLQLLQQQQDLTNGLLNRQILSRPSLNHTL